MPMPMPTRTLMKRPEGQLAVKEPTTAEQIAKVCRTLYTDVLLKALRVLELILRSHRDQRPGLIRVALEEWARIHYGVPVKGISPIPRMEINAAINQLKKLEKAGFIGLCWPFHRKLPVQKVTAFVADQLEKLKPFGRAYQLAFLVHVLRHAPYYDDAMLDAEPLDTFEVMSRIMTQPDLKTEIDNAHNQLDPEQFLGWLALRLGNCTDHYERRAILGYALSFFGTNGKPEGRDLISDLLADDFLGRASLRREPSPGNGDDPTELIASLFGDKGPDTPGGRAGVTILKVGKDGVEPVVTGHRAGLDETLAELLETNLFRGASPAPGA